MFAREKKGRWVFLIVPLFLLGCVTPSAGLIQNAEVEWRGLVAPNACPAAFPYRVQVRNEVTCENRTLIDGAGFRAACRLAAHEWTTEVIRNSEMLGCSADRHRSEDIPLLSITLRNIKIEGGGSKGIACATSMIYGAGLIYSVMDAEHAVTTRADVELRQSGRVLWSGKIYGQERVDRDMWDVSTLIYEQEMNRLGDPLRAALEELRNRIFVQTRTLNARLRGESS